MHLNQWKSLLSTHQRPLQLTHLQVPQPPQPQITMESLHQNLLQKLQSANDPSMQPEHPATGPLLQKLAELQELAQTGQLKGVGLFWSVPGGYNCFITNLGGDVFGLYGYTAATTDRYMGEYLDNQMELEDSEDFDDPEDEETTF